MTDIVVSDLNIINMYITSLYTLIHRLSGDESKNWISFFTLASNKNGTKRANDINKILKDLGMTIKDLRELQALRKRRNKLCHPHVPLSVARLCCYARWKEHSSYSSLEKMFAALKKKKKLFTKWKANDGISF